MAKPLPAPPSPPSGRASRIIRSIRDLAEAEPADDAAYAQRVIDLQHIAVTAADVIDRAYFEAVKGQHVSYRGIAERTGLSPSAVQDRVANGANGGPTSTRTDGED